MYNDFNYGYDLVTPEVNSLAGSTMWGIIAFIIAIAATVCLFVVFLNKNNEKKFSGFLGWLYNFLNFKVFTIELILKVTYVCLAIYLTLSSFALIGTSFMAFLICIIGGNIALRVTYELLMLLVSICTNVSEINKKLKSKENKGE